MIHSEGIVGDIFIQPPDVDTDEDSADEDEGGERYILVPQFGYIISFLFYRLVVNLKTGQPLANAGIRFYKNDRSTIEEQSMRKLTVQQ